MKFKCGCDPEGGSKPCKKHLATRGLSLGKKRLVLVYIAKFNPCIYESEYGVISVHSTFESAMKALKEHKENYIIEYDEPESYVKWQVGEHIIHD